MLVPSGQPTAVLVTISPPCITTFVPVLESLVFVSISVLVTAAMLARASPLNPSVSMCLKSSAVHILLVACLRNAFSVSSKSIPEPLSVTLMYSLPPLRISTVIEEAPASIEFSVSSLIMETGLSTTSPAAILSATFLVSIFIIFASEFITLLINKYIS